MPPTMRDRLEQAENENLAPYAVRAANRRRRHRLAGERRAFDYRTSFQRDRDRIVYSRAFRRLRQKAVAGTLPEYEDHRRNRMTHTLEVVQLARTIGRSLSLNEDLVEAVALGHDLGMPPFGPAGERALDDALAGRLDGRGGPGLGDLGGFDRGIQNLRVVDRLEKRYEHPGLNLTDVVREGLWKCATVRIETADPPDGLRVGLAPYFEAQVVGLADRLATGLHDLDDALQAGGVDVGQVERLRAVAELRRKLGAAYRPRASRFMKANAIHRGLTHLLVTGAILHSGKALQRWAERHEVDGPERFEQLAGEAIRGNEVGLNDAGTRLVEDLEGFLETRVRRRREAYRVDARGRRVVLGLLAAYHQDPGLLDDHVLLRWREIGGRRYLRDVPAGEVAAEVGAYYRRDPRFVRLVADHLAAMTDPYALAEHARLMEMGAIPIPGREQLRREEDA